MHRHATQLYDTCHGLFDKLRRGPWDKEIPIQLPHKQVPTVFASLYIISVFISNTMHIASLRQPDIEFGHFKRLLKAFLF